MKIFQIILKKRGKNFVVLTCTQTGPLKVQDEIRGGFHLREKTIMRARKQKGSQIPRLGLFLAFLRVFVA